MTHWGLEAESIIKGDPMTSRSLLRLSVFVFATVAFTSPAIGQNWKVLPSTGFSVPSTPGLAALAIDNFDGLYAVSWPYVVNLTNSGWQIYAHVPEGPGLGGAFRLEFDATNRLYVFGHYQNSVAGAVAVLAGGSWTQLDAGLGLPAGLTTALTSQLRAAQNSLSAGNQTAAKNQLNAFSNLVRAQSGRSIPAAQATALMTAADAVFP
jgi:FIMAH domain-containing protein